MANPNQLPSEGYLRLNQLVGKNNDTPPIVPVSKGTIWNWVKQGLFPKPIKLSPSVTVWRVEDVRDYLNNSADQSNAA